MPALAKIKTAQISLDDLIKNSFTIQRLPEVERKKLIEHIKALPQEKQKQVADALLKEKTELEAVDKNAADKRKAVAENSVAKIKEETIHCKRTFRKNREVAAEKEEAAQETDILKKLNNS